MTLHSQYWSLLLPVVKHKGSVVCLVLYICTDYTVCATDLILKAKRSLKICLYGLLKGRFHFALLQQSILCLTTRHVHMLAGQ